MTDNSRHITCDLVVLSRLPRSLKLLAQPSSGSPVLMFTDRFIPITWGAIRNEVIPTDRAILMNRVASIKRTAFGAWVVLVA